MEWIVSRVTGSNYICHDALKSSRNIILATYETAHKRRYVKQVECLYGRVMKKVGGEIIAWMPLPKPYKGPKHGLLHIEENQTK